MAGAAPAADAEADPQYLAAAPVAYAGAAVAPAVVPASNCKTVVEIFTTQTCVPAAEKVCKLFTDNICDAPAVAAAPVSYIAKRDAEAEAEADPQYLLGGYAAAPLAAAPVAAPVVAAHAVAHSAKTTVQHACREVTTEHCVDNPKIKLVPVEVEHCHTITKVTCTPVDNEVPTTQCEPVTTEHLSHAAYAAPYVYGK